MLYRSAAMHRVVCGFARAGAGAVCATLTAGDFAVLIPWIPATPSVFQIETLRTRLDGWVEKVSSAALTLEDEAVGVAQAS